MQRRAGSAPGAPGAARALPLLRHELAIHLVPVTAPALPACDGSPFQSFWMGGFEGADHINDDGRRLDMAAANGHADRLDEDFAGAAALGIRSVRESVGWRLCESEDGAFDFSRVRRIADAARRQRMQVVWSLMHYGLPDGVDLHGADFCERFVRFATAAARVIGPLSRTPPVYNPINEISFLAWAVSATRLMGPHSTGELPAAAEDSTLEAGYALKCRLVQAAVRAVRAIRSLDPRARFLHIEPVVHVVAPPDRPESAGLAERVAGFQWQVWDMLAGHAEPQLGGGPDVLDLIGVNHYHSGQWEVQTEQRLWWHARDQRRRPLAQMLELVWQRYRRPLIVAETSHVGTGRAQWLHEVVGEVRTALRGGVPVEGICLYPLIDRPDWNDPGHWHHSGLWDVAPAAAHGGAGDGSFGPPHRRVLCVEYAAALSLWQNNRPESGPDHMNCIVVFSHLRWNFVFQRPQHLLSRLARQYRILFVEEPVHEAGDAWLDRQPQGPNLDVLVPHTPVDAAGFDDRQLPVLRELLQAHLAAERIERPVLWFYTPLALPLLDDAFEAPRAVVYDCMDELSAFLHAPPQLREREAALLARADLVLTGGPRLYEARRASNPNVLCLPSAVDARHFAPARLDAASPEAREVAQSHEALPRPRLGFFGVIDERLDLALIAVVAALKPQWQWIFVGPVVKIDPATLPRPANVHWLGSQPYARLPHFCAAWDVCLMPFAINEATRFISPTKTLEYMAADRAIVSTPVHDVIALYGEVVEIAATATEFVAACERLLHEAPDERARRSTLMEQIVARSSWDSAADTARRALQVVLDAGAGNEEDDAPPLRNDAAVRAR